MSRSPHLGLEMVSTPTNVLSQSRSNLGQICQLLGLVSVLEEIGIEPIPSVHSTYALRTVFQFSHFKLSNA